MKRPKSDKTPKFEIPDKSPHIVRVYEERLCTKGHTVKLFRGEGAKEKSVICLECQKGGINGKDGGS